MNNAFITLVVLLTFSVSYGQSLTVDMTSDSILLGNALKVKFAADNVDGNIQYPEFENADIISGPNQSSSVQIINGEKTSSKSVSFIIKPKEIGTYYIPPAYLDGEDISLETMPMEYNVYPNPQGIITEIESEENGFFGRFEMPFDDFFNYPPMKKEPQKKKQTTKSKQKLRKI